MPTAVYRVTGMTCDHCVRAITDELHKLPGVQGVDVDLTAGDVRIESDAPVDRAAVEAAVEGAGYQLLA
jgi:copper chaperone